MRSHLRHKEIVLTAQTVLPLPICPRLEQGAAWPEHGPNLGKRRLITWTSQRKPRSQATSGHFPPTPSIPLISLGD
jgi:hypothetical protein